MVSLACREWCPGTRFFDHSLRLGTAIRIPAKRLNRTSLGGCCELGRCPRRTQVVERGTTMMVGCRIRGFNQMGLNYLPQTINGSFQRQDGNS
jgi:hypothetical protein